MMNAFISKLLFSMHYYYYINLLEFKGLQDYQFSVHFVALPAPDECSKDPCHEFADCTNVGSTYTCDCKDGYMGNGVFCMGMIVIY